MNADEIREVRESFELSQEAFARLLRVSFATVNRWEKGRATPDEEMAEQLHILKNLLDQPQYDKKRMKNFVDAAGLGSLVSLGVLAAAAPMVGPLVIGPMAGLLALKNKKFREIFEELFKKKKRG